MTAPSTFVASGTFLNPDGTNSVQKVVFTPAVTRSVNNDNIVNALSITAVPVNGVLSQTLLQLSAGYTVQEYSAGGQVSTYSIAGTANIDLGTITAGQLIPAGSSGGGGGGALTAAAIIATGITPAQLGAAGLVGGIVPASELPLIPATTTRPTTGPPTVQATDVAGDFAIDATAQQLYGPFNGTTWATRGISIGSVLINVCNPQWGAVGDGVTDNGPAFAKVNAALAAAGSTATKIVYIPAGVYTTSVGLALVNYTTVYGDGSATQLLQPPAAIDPTGSVILISGTQCDGIIVRDLWLNGNFANVAKSGAFILPSTQDSQATLGAAITNTTLGANLAAAANGASQTMQLAAGGAAAAGIVNGSIIQVGGEQMLVTSAPASDSFTVTRGYLNSSPVNTLTGGGPQALNSGAVVGNCTLTLAAAHTYPGVGTQSFAVQIDNELMFVQAGNGTATLRVKRGCGTLGSTSAIAAHANGAALRQTTGNGLNNSPDTSAFDAIIASTNAGYGPTGLKSYLYDGTPGSVDNKAYLATRTPIKLTDCTNCNISRFRISDTVTGGILVTGTQATGTANFGTGGATGSKEILIRNGIIQRHYDNGVFCHGGTEWVTIEGVHAMDGVYSGIACTYTNHVSILGCQTKNHGPSDSDSGGIICDGGNDWLIVGNIVQNALHVGIQCESSQETGQVGGLGSGQAARAGRTLIEANTVLYCQSYAQTEGGANPTYSATAGIDIDGANEPQVFGNTVAYCDLGINIGSATFHPTVKSNIVRYSTLNGISVAGIESVVSPLIIENLVEKNGIGTGSAGINTNVPARFLRNIITGNGGDGIGLGDSEGTIGSGIPAAARYWLVDGGEIKDNGATSSNGNGITIFAGAGSQVDVRNVDFGSLPIQEFPDGSVTAGAAGSATIGSALGKFVAADVGATIQIEAAAADGVTDVITTITAVSGGVATLAAQCFWTRNPVYFSITRGMGRGLASTQVRAFYNAGNCNMLYENNRSQWHNGQTYFNAGTGTLVARNNHASNESLSLDTNNGVATLTSGNTSVTLNHGLAGTPPLSLISVEFDFNTGPVWITGITATQFVVNWATAAGASNHLGWLTRLAL